MQEVQVEELPHQPNAGIVVVQKFWQLYHFGQFFAIFGHRPI